MRGKAISGCKICLQDLLASSDCLKAAGMISIERVRYFALSSHRLTKLSHVMPYPFTLIHHSLSAIVSCFISKKSERGNLLPMVAWSMSGAYGGQRDRIFPELCQMFWAYLICEGESASHHDIVRRWYKGVSGDWVGSSTFS